MQTRLQLIMVAFLLCSITALSQIKLVEKVEQKGTELVIPYEKYVLPNGLTIILHEDRSDPIVRIDVTYHVGSAREEIGKSGFAHFFEHMLFQGSDNVADEQHFKIVSDAGGTINGSTNRDRTNYYQTVPANQLEKVLWLEADRMGFFLDAVTQKKFEIQRSTVKNERGQNFDNVPYGNVFEFSGKNLYPFGHPYSWLTIGFEEDLNRVELNDVKNFFLRWYGPNNAILTIGGDIDKQQTLKWIEKYFNSIKRGPNVEPTKYPVPSLAEHRFVSYTDNYARLPMLSITYPTVPNYHSDLVTLQCLAQIIAQGKNSVLYQYITKKQKATNTLGLLFSSELAGELIFRIIPTPSMTLKEEWELFKSALDSFEANGGVKQDDIDRFRGSALSDLINSMQSVSTKVSTLAEYATIANNANKLPEIIKLFKALTPQSVMAVYNKYMKNKGAVVASILTKGQEKLIAAADNYKIDSTQYSPPDYGYTGLSYVKGRDNFDRKKIPPAGKPVSVKVPVYWQKDLANGIRFIGTENSEVPTVNLTISIPGGHILQANDLSKAGLANVFAQMMNEDTKNYTAEAMNIALQKLGSNVSFSSSNKYININVQSLKTSLDETLKLLEERLFNPNFTEAAFARNKKQRLNTFRLAKANPSQVADAVFAKVNYGSGHIFGISQNGTEQTISNIFLADVNSYYDNYMTSQGMKVVVVGDVKEAEILPKLNFLNKLPNKKVTLPTVPPAPSTGNSKVYMIDVPQSAQTAFRVGYPTNLKYDATGEFYKARLMNFPLGQGFNSRLNLNLREDKGWTYGAGTNFYGTSTNGEFEFNSGIRADATDSALAEVMKEIKNYHANGPTQEEIVFMKNSLGQRDALNYETGFQKAGFLAPILEYNLPANYVEQQNKILANTTKKDMDAQIKKHLKPNNMQILLVGDKEKIYESVKKLGYDIIELDVDGNAVNKKAM
jgi:zinc protease